MGGVDLKKPILLLIITLFLLSLLACADIETTLSTSEYVAGEIRMPIAMSVDSTDEDVHIPLETEGDIEAVQWSSSNPAILQVDQTGELSVLAEGIATITATSGSFTSSTQVIVTVDKYKDYVRIRTKAEFLAIFSIPENFNSPDHKYALATDIDFGGNSIDPIGGWDVSNDVTPIDTNRQFRATLDGRGFALKNFEINNPPSTKVGNDYFGVSLIPFLYDGKVMNLNIIGATFSGSGFTGSIAGKILYGTIENCFVQATITATSRNLGIPSGGIAGIIGPEATVKNVILDVKVNSGYIYSGFNFGLGTNCSAVSATLDDSERRVPIQNTAVSTMKGNELEDAELNDFLQSVRIENEALGMWDSYPLTVDAKAFQWTIAEGYMPFLIRTDGMTPEWAKIEEVITE
jgi:hypothetical protein